MPDALSAFKAVWVIDFEFVADAGENPSPVCLVAHELKSKAQLRLWRDELERPPFDVGRDSLFIAFFSSAERFTWSAPMRRKLA